MRYIDTHVIKCKPAPVESRPSGKEEQMREYRFRGKRLDNGEWVFGDLTRYSEEMSYITVDLVEGNVYQVSTITIGQFTGLKDKNGVEIWEGDIVRQHFYKELGSYSDNETIEGYVIGSVVIIPSKGACLKNPLQRIEYNGEVDEELKRTKMYKNVVQARSEVIGNIHDNPELLEVHP